MKGPSFVILCLVALTIVGCQKPQQATSPPQPNPLRPDQQKSEERPETYFAKGVIIELVPEKCGAFIHHQAIPGFMDEMTMFLKIAHREEYETLRVGQEYTFTLLVAHENDTRTQDFVPTGNATALDTTSTSPGERWLTAPTFELGDRVPEFTLNAANGDTITAKSLQGQVWAMTFIFTRCPLPDYCPRMTLRFKEAMEILVADKVIDWKLISLTIDPDHDRIEVLKTYKTTWDIQSKNWFFCRAEKESLKQLGDPLGLRYQADESPIEHNLRTAVFDREGRLAEVFSGNSWTALELAASMKKAAAQNESGVQFHSN